MIFVADAGAHTSQVPTLATHPVSVTMNAGTDYHLLSSYASLLTLAVLIIYSGSYGSLPVRQILTLVSPPD